MTATRMQATRFLGSVRGALAARPALAGLGVAVAVQLWAYRHLLEPVSWPNDLSFHLSMATWAEGRFRAGQVPVDGWYPRLSGGLPQFHLYQSLPHLLTGGAGVPLGTERALHLFLWLLVATWPIPVFIGARALGLTDRAALVAGVVAPLARSATGYGFEPFSYLWLGNGLWSQAWGMWVAPLALGWSARAVRTGRGFGRAVLAVALTVAFHLPTAWFVLVALGLWVVVRPSEWRARVGRTVGLSVLAVVASAWVLVPFLADRWAANDSSFNGEAHLRESFGWRRVLGWVLGGDIVDARRLPVLSALAAVGLVVVLIRWRSARPGDPEVAALAGLSLVLFIGTDPFGPLIGLLPGSSQVFLHRYVATLQLALALLAGIAADELLDRLARWWSARSSDRLRPIGVAGAVLLPLLLLAPAARSTWSLVASDRSWVARQRIADRGIGADASELVAIASARGPGRIFAGKLNGSGGRFLIGGVAAPVWLAHLPVDAIGFNLRVSALAADLEPLIDESGAADLDALGVRYVLVPRGGTAPRGAWFLAARGDVQLWELPGAGLVSAVQVVGPPLSVPTDRIAADVLPVMRGQGGSPTAVRLLDLAGRSPSVDQASGSPQRPGRLERTRIDLDGGSIRTRARFDRPGAVLVKANWHPRWRATVDGRAVPVAAVAPTWMAVPVAAGDHEVVVRYVPWAWTPWLLAAGAGAVLIGAAWSRRTRWPGAKRRLGRVLAGSSVLLAAGCGAPHRLPSTSSPRLDPAAPMASVAVRRSDSYATLDRILAPDRPTVLVLAGPDCDRCGPALVVLRDRADRGRPFSLIVLGAGSLPDDLAEVAASVGASAWDVPRAVPRLRRLLDIDAGSGVAIVSPDGSVLHRWAGIPDPATVVALARKEP